MRKELIELYYKNEKFIKYCMISFFSTILMFSLFFIINLITNGLYIVANVIAYTTSFTVLFILDRKLFNAVPKRKRDKAKQLSNFIIFRGIGLIIDSILLTIFIEYFKIPHFISKIMSSSMTFMYNYMTNKLFVFKNKNI